MKERISKSFPRVSVITVNYNSGVLLRRTLDSFRKQCYDNLEVVVVDGKSTDDALNVIQEYSDIINRWVSEPDCSIYDAMNKGVRMAGGEWIVFINAGDMFCTPHTLSDVFAHGVSMADVVYGDVEKNGQIKTAPDTYRLYHRMLFCHQCAFTRRTLLLDLPFDTNFCLSADHKFFVTLWQRGARFLHVSVPVAVFDTEGVSNRQRSRGLRDNMSVMSDTLGFPRCVPYVLRLLIPFVLCRLRGR